MTVIGKELKKRMKLLNMTVTSLSNQSFLDEDMIKKLLHNKLAYEDIDEFDKELLCRTLHCDTEYFVNENVRKQDFLSSSKNSHMSRKETVTKMKLQDFIGDFAFVTDIATNER